MKHLKLFENYDSTFVEASEEEAKLLFYDDPGSRKQWKVLTDEEKAAIRKIGILNQPNLGMPKWYELGIVYTKNAEYGGDIKKIQLIKIINDNFYIFIDHIEEPNEYYKCFGLEGLIDCLNKLRRDYIISTYKRRVKKF
mgnify:CR=1 FL=1